MPLIPHRYWDGWGGERVAWEVRVRLCPHVEWVVCEAHDRSGKVRLEREIGVVENQFPIRVQTEQIGLDSGVVDPDAVDSVVALEDHHLVALPLELTSYQQVRMARYIYTHNIFINLFIYINR